MELGQTNIYTLHAPKQQGCYAFQPRTDNELLSFLIIIA